jgi:ribosomal protein S18 acetylase RimI-like enzyme
LIVREARPEDDAAIGELLVDAFLTTYARKMPEVVYDDARKNELRDVATKRGRALVLVAELGGRVVGTVAIFRPGAPGSEAWLPNSADLRHLAVAPELHGKGVAKPLLDRAEAVARDDWKVDGICLHVRKGAGGVARLYEGRGFRRDPSGDIEKPTVTLEAYALRCAPPPAAQ